VRAGRLSATVAVLSALAFVAVAAPSLARMQHHQVQVVKSGFARLVVWDSANAQKGLCFRLVASLKSSARCDRSGKHKLRLSYTSFVESGATYVGGDARRGEATVTATFADGQTLTMKTVRGKRYHGRQRGKARFWAGSTPDVTNLVSVIAKNSSGATVETITVTPAPQPKPPPPCPPCGGPPRAQAQGGGRVVCPLVLCPA
jgi:hypothetical protein